MRAAAIALASALVLSGGRATADENAAKAFSEQTDGLWSALPSPPLSSVSMADLEVGLRACSGDGTADGTTLVRFVTVEGRTIRLRSGAEPVAILDVRDGGVRRGYNAWLVATNEGVSALLLGKVGPVDLMLTDEASYVRCPADGAEAVNPTR